MVDPVTATTILIATLASAFMAWAIGAGSSGSTPFAPAVGANAISVMRAGFLVGILGFAGAVFQGGNVTEAVGRELIGGQALTPLAATITLLLAASLVATGVFLGYPIATAFTVTGAVVGVGIAMGGTPAWEKYTSILTLWVLTPFVGGGSAYVTAKLFRSDVPDQTIIPTLAAIVGAILAHVHFSFIGGGSTLAREGAQLLPVPRLFGVVVVTGGMALAAAVLIYQRLRADPVVAQRRFLLFLGGLVAFSAGGSQVGLALGPLLPLLEPFRISLPVLLFGGGLGLLLGSWTGAPRMIKTISQDYSSLGPGRSIAALIPSFGIAQTAVLFGIPVSFNEIIVSAIIGSGYAVESAGVSSEKMIKTIGAWVISLVLALGLGFGLYVGVGRLLP